MFQSGTVLNGTDPIIRADAIVASDVADQFVQRPPRYLICTVSGNIKVDFWDYRGQAKTLVLPVVAGTVYNYAIARLWSTLTTATVLAAF